MAEVVADASVAPVVEDVDFSLGETLPIATNNAADDFDFDLDAGEVQTTTTTEVLPHKTSAESSVELSLDIEEIGYEEEGEHIDEASTPQLDLTAAKDITTEATHSAAEIVEAAEGAEVTADLDVNAHEEHKSELEQTQTDELHNDIDFNFEDAGDDAEQDHHDESMGYEEHDQDHKEHHHEAHDDNQASEEEDADMSHIHAEEAGQDDSDDSGQEYDEDAENAGDNRYGASPYGSLNSGIGRLQAFDPATNLDVVVTWGDDVCPLFKTPDAEDPDSFYLEDRDVLDYPLSQFLQAIRNKISTYIVTTDEIYIRVESLGLEFGETTTEALLSQVTFHNLLALHTTLVKNEDEDSMEIQGVHITLGTRPNCLLRLKDLVSGAGRGMGLSDLQTTHHSSENSSIGSFEGGLELELEVQVTDEDDDEEDHHDADEVEDDEEGGDDNEDEDEEGIDIDMAGDDSGESENAHEDAEPGVLGPDQDQDQDQGQEYDLEEQESPNADDDEIEDGVNEVEFAAYNYDEEEEKDHGENSEEAVGGLLFAAESTTPDRPAANADDLVEEAAFGDGSDLLADIADEADNADNGDSAVDADNAAGVEEHDELDLLEDINDAGNLAGKTGEDILQQATDEPALANEDDDFLDLGDDLTGDLGGSALVADALDTSDANNVFAEEANASLGTSATATLDHDEIDYEDNNGEIGMNNDDNDNDNEIENDQRAVSTDVGVADEIDWDVELKNAANLTNDSEATPTTGSVKRTREVEESGDNVLLDNEPEFKRQRADDTSL